MKAGREMDALVAEKVFGGESSHPDWYWFRNTVVEGLPDLPKVEGQEPLFAGPNFSTDIAAVWDVVETLLPASCFDLGWDPSQGGWWRVSYCKEAGGEAPEGVDFDEWIKRWVSEAPLNRCWHFGVAKTAPHAICLAALKAVGVEVPE